MIVDIENKGDKLNISYIDDDGNIAYLEQHIPVEERFNWQICQEFDKAKDQVYKTWDNKFVKKTKTNRLNKFRVEELLMELDQDKKDLIYKFNTPNKYMVDIETEITDGFPNANDAKNRVINISIANSQKHKVYVLGIKPLTVKEIDSIQKQIDEHFKPMNDKWEFIYNYYETEFDMMFTFFNTIVPKMACISGWYFLDYDWKYLLNRCPKLGIDPKISSPARFLQGKSRIPMHKLIIDYKEIYDKWDRVIKIKDNSKLDHVAEQAIGIKKITYTSGLKDLYEHDYVRFVFYSAVDSVLVHYIDKKLNTMSTFFKISDVAKIAALRAYSPIWVTEALMVRVLKERKMVFVEKEPGEKRSFAGAFVKDPVPGIYDHVACLDFASLYPNTMAQFNISPETYKGIKHESELKEGEIRLASGAVFENSTDSVLREILMTLYKKRKEVKSKYLQLEKEINYLNSFK
jgi:DNA polymerase elongation subunit (family B)